MKTDNQDVILFFSDHTGEILQVGTLEQYITFNEATLETPLERTIESIMIDPNKFGKSLMYDLASDYKEHQYKFKISYICLYMAVCCCIGKTDICKPLLNSLVNACHVSIYDFRIQNVKDILKAIIKGMIDKYSELFEDIAKSI